MDSGKPEKIPCLHPTVSYPENFGHTVFKSLIIVEMKFREQTDFQPGLSMMRARPAFNLALRARNLS